MLKIDCLQYQIVSNPAAGIEPVISDVHDSHVYNPQQAARWLEIEAQFFETFM